MDKKYCVIVDAYGSSSYLPGEFIQRGFACIHVASPGEKSDYYIKSFHPEDFALIIPQNTPIAEMTVQLKNFPIVCVVAGTDAAVLPADELATALGLTQNISELSPARRYKHLMAERLAHVHLPHITHIKSLDPDEIINWANKGHHWPIIIKPVDAAATEGLSICNHPDEVKIALAYLLNFKSFLGHHFETAIAQPFITGTEYIVNTVSCLGEHYVSDIWVSHKFHTEHDIIYDYMELLPANGIIQQTLSDYTIKVVDALGIRTGPGHSEVMLTTKGPVLIETNCRIMGLGIPPAIQSEALSHTQLSLTADAFVDHDAFKRHTSEAYRLNKHLVCVLHQVMLENAVVNESALELIEQLTSFRLRKLSHLGKVHKTKDLLTSPGWVVLMHEDENVIHADIQRLREIEREHLFIRQL